MPIFDFLRRSPSLPPPPAPDVRQASWNRTAAIEGRLRDTPDYRPPSIEAPYGYYGGRKIIGSGMSEVIDGVYLGGGAREAIVVKEKLPDERGELHDAAILKAYLAFMLKRYQACERNGKEFYSNLLLDAFKEVSAMMRYDEAAVNAIVGQAMARQPDQKIALDRFVNGHVGVCRHQALLMAYFLQKLIQEPNPRYGLRGTFSLERNSVATPTQAVGAHVWVRFTSANSGRVYILDVAQNVCAELKTVIGDPTKWVYARPEELAAFRRAS